MANRYWVIGGSQLWNNPNNWSTTSGGPSGASVPGISDVAIFDSNSGTSGSFMSTNFTIQSLVTTGYAGKLYFRDPAATVFTTLTITGTTTDTIVLGGTAATYDSYGTINISLTAGAVRNISVANFSIPFSLRFSGASTANPSSINFLTNVSCQTAFIASACGFKLNGFSLTAETVTVNNATVDYGASGSSAINVTGVNKTVFTSYTTVTAQFDSTSTQKPIVNLLGNPPTGGTRSITSAGSIFSRFSFKLNGGDNIFFSAGYVLDLDASAFTGKINGWPAYVSGNFLINPAITTTNTTNSLINVWTRDTNNPVQNFSCDNPNLYVSFSMGVAANLAGRIKLTGNFYSYYGINYVAGSLDLNGYVLSTISFTSSSTSARTLNFNNGTVEITSTTGTSTFSVNAANLTYAGTGNIKATCNSTGTIIIDPNSTNIPVNLILNSLSRINILGSNTFLSLTNTQIGILSFVSGAKNIFLNGFSLTGNSTTKYTLTSSAASVHYLGMPSGNANCDWLLLAWSSAAYGNTPDPLGYNSVWYAGPNSTVLSGSTVVNWFPVASGQFLAFFP